MFPMIVDLVVDGDGTLNCLDTTQDLSWPRCINNCDSFCTNQFYNAVQFSGFDLGTNLGND